MPPRKETVSDGESLTTTLAVDKDIAAKIKEVAKEAGTSAMEVTNQLLRLGLEHGKINVQVRTVTIDMKSRAKK